MTEEQAFALRIVLYVAGWLLSIIWPYLIKFVNEGEPFNWRLVSGRILAGLIGLVTILAAETTISQLGAIGYVGAFLMGFGASSFGRNVQRTPSVITRPSVPGAKPPDHLDVA